MKNPLGVSPSKPHEVKKKSFDLGGKRTHDLRIRSTVTLTTELRGRTEKVGDDLGGESQRRETYECTYECTLSFFVRPRSSVGRVTLDLIRRTWVRFPPRSKDFFLTSCGSLIPFTRANAQWVIQGLN